MGQQELICILIGKRSVYLQNNWLLFFCGIWFEQDHVFIEKALEAKQSLPFQIVSGLLLSFKHLFKSFFFLCTPRYPGTHSVAEAGLKLRDLCMCLPTGPWD